MMKRYLPLIFLAMPGWAYSSLAVTLGARSVLKVPAVAPFTSLGDYRVEFRMHGWSPTSNSNTAFFSWGSVFSGARYLEILMKPSGEICAANWVDTMSRGNQSCANLTGHNDVIVRVQRFGDSYPSRAGAVGSFALEAQDVNGSPIAPYCGSGHPEAAYACSIDATAVKNWSGINGYVGNPTYPTAFSLDWLKWSSTTTAPGSPFSQESTPADLADWRFENNLNNQGTGAYNVTIGSFSSGPFYGLSPGYAPTCVAGPQQTFRAGYPAQLDGTNAYSLNGDPQLAYFWQELSGPTGALSSGRGTARPTVIQTIFGSYVFQLTVTDTSGQSSTCTVKHGFVATDNNNVVIHGSAPVDTLLGPMIRYGANPWPWFDDRHKAEADFNIAQLSTYYKPFWVDSQKAGTVAVTAGSATVIGSGTSFTTTFCQGPGNPTAPIQVAGGQNVYLLVWYPNSSEEGYGLRFTPVASCQSDTQLTLSNVWYGDVADCHNGGCAYSYDDASNSFGGLWFYPNGEGSNYYDAVAAYYSLYYRTGIDDYLTAARTLADRFWKYRLDSGTECRYGGIPYPNRCGGSDQPRTKSLLGMVLRALDGRTDMWPGLEKLFVYHQTLLISYYLNPYNPLYIDIREAAYSMAMVAYCALYDPTSSNRSSCRSTLSTMMNGYWNVKQAPDGSWQQLYTTAGSWTPGTTSVSLTHGSANVVGNGTSWTSSQFDVSGLTNKRHIVFLPTTSAPANYQAQTEGTYYSPTFVDSTHLTLDRPYEGTTGVHGWMVGSSATGAVGWGAQPYLEGILGLAFEFTALALADSDPANAALAHQHNVDIANWQMSYGYRSAVKGMQYHAGEVDCQPPILESMTWCNSNYTPTQARTLSAETLRSVMLAYSYGRQSALLSFAGTLYNAMFAKPATCPSDSAVCLPDGQYITDLNSGTGWYMTGVPWANSWHKYFGMMFGIGAGSDWPAYHIGGPKVKRGRIVRLAFDMQGIPGAASVRVTSMAPSGEIVQTPCAASPCTVAIDDRQGDYVFNLEYLSSNGTVLASTALPVVQGH
jgi:hypothetical protein